MYPHSESISKEQIAFRTGVESTLRHIRDLERRNRELETKLKETERLFSDAARERGYTLVKKTYNYELIKFGEIKAQ